MPIYAASMPILGGLMMKIRRWYRRPLPVSLALVATTGLFVGTGYVVHQMSAPCWPNPMPPDDPRAYHPRDCYVTNENTTTFESMLKHYAITLPESVNRLRYYSDDTASNGPDTLFLRFDTSPSGLGEFLKSAGATPKGADAATSTRPWSGEWQEFGVDWHFDPGKAYQVYEFGHGLGVVPSGLVVVDTGQQGQQTVYVIDSVM